jgi:asparagine synthase (glutamine-hydrolysing)
VTRNLESGVPENYRKNAGSLGHTVLQQMTTADFHTYLPDDILVKVDRASMLASLEVRAPFLDYRIVEFAFGKIPDSCRATPRDRKVLLRLLAKRLLPDLFDAERKQGFSVPLQTWFSGDWGAYLTSVLKSAPAELYDPSRVSTMISNQKRGFVNAQRLFNLAFLELWRREYSVELPA